MATNLPLKAALLYFFLTTLGEVVNKTFPYTSSRHRATEAVIYCIVILLSALVWFSSTPKKTS